MTGSRGIRAEGISNGRVVVVLESDEGTRSFTITREEAAGLANDLSAILGEP